MQDNLPNNQGFTPQPIPASQPLVPEFQNIPPENNNTQQRNPTTPETSVNPPTTPPIKSTGNHSTLVMILSVLLLLACLVAGFFAWQTQRLVKELSTKDSSQLFVPSPTEVPELTSYPSSDLKNYKNTKYNYSLSYPNNWNLRGIAGSQQNTEEYDSFIIEGPYENIDTLEGTPKYSLAVKVQSSEPTVTSDSSKLVDFKKLSNEFIVFEMTKLVPEAGSLDTRLFNQILSSLNITSSQITPTNSATPTPQL